MSEDIAKEVAEEQVQEILGNLTEDGEYPNDSGMGGYAVCPRCNWNTRELQIPVGEEDKEEFLRCILGDKQFSKEYSLFGDNLKVAYTDLTSIESDNMVVALNELTEDPLFLVKAIKIKLIFALLYAKTGGQEIQVDRTKLTAGLSAEKALAEYDSKLGSFSETLCGALAKVYNEFNAMLIALTESGFDEDFWKGAGRD